MAGSEGQSAPSARSASASHPPAAAPAAASNKKGKGKKAAADPADTSKLVEQTIAQLEKSKAGDREQELEIEREVKKATRELASSLAGCDSAIARIDYVQKRYAALVGEMKKLEREHRAAKRKADLMQKERDGAKTELTKMTSVKDKLEKLSRETTNENRKLRANVQQCEDKDAKVRNELMSRLNDMSSGVEQAIHTREQVRSQSATIESDELFGQKFRSFTDQYELRELHFKSLLRSKDLEIAFHMKKFEQQRRAKEMESSKSHQLTRQVSTFSQTESELRNQLNIYVEKFKQVEDTLNSSNDLFLTFRKEMEEMSKKTKRLEKENLSLTRKHEATNQSIIKMAEERTRAHKEIVALKRKNENLEKLCRGMQAQGRGLAPTAAAAAAHGAHEDAASASEYDDEGTGDGTFEIDDSCPIHGTNHVHDHTCFEDSHGEECEADGDDELDDEYEERREQDEAEDSDVLPSADRAPPPAKRASARGRAMAGKAAQLLNGTTPPTRAGRKGTKPLAGAGGARAAGANGIKR